VPLQYSQPGELKEMKNRDGQRKSVENNIYPSDVSPLAHNAQEFVTKDNRSALK